MAYCSKCGKQMKDGAIFCSSCGTRMASSREEREGKRAEQYDGEIHKCPSCGQTLDSLEVICPSCGYELRGAEAVGSLKELSNQLQQIRMQPDKGLRQTLIERLGRVPTDADDRAAALIKAYPIPNTKEDLIEFIITSAANINPDTFNDFKRSNVSSSDIAMSNAWLSKLEQAYQKASITLNGDEAFERIEAIYSTTMRKVSWARHAMLRFWIILALFWAAILVFCLIMAAINPEVR